MWTVSGWLVRANGALPDTVWPTAMDVGLEGLEGCLLPETSQPVRTRHPAVKRTAIRRGLGGDMEIPSDGRPVWMALRSASKVSLFTGGITLIFRAV